MEEKRLFFLKCGLAIFLLAAVIGLLAWGGGTPLAAPSQSVVTQVEITSADFQRQYTSPEKMNAVLDYLRRAPVYPLPQGAQIPDGQALDFFLTLSDGSRRHYRQQAGGYLCREKNAWKKLDELQASMVVRLLRKLPSDDAPQF